MTRPEWIEVGRVSRAHGVHGEVRIVPGSDNPERFAPGSVLYGRPARRGLAGPRVEMQVPLTVESVRGGDDFPIVAFSEVGGRDAAEALRGYVLEVRSSQLPELPDDEYYPFDLAGLEVQDPGGRIIGRVTEVVESPAHAILVVSLEQGREAMVPFVHDAVPVVAVSEGRLVVEPGFIAYGGGDVDATEAGGAAGGADRA